MPHEETPEPEAEGIDALTLERRDGLTLGA